MNFLEKLITRLAMICLVWIAANGLFVQAQKKPSPNIKQSQNTSTRFTVGKSALKIPLDIDNNIIRMQVSVNGSKPLKFIFDTGASFSLIDSQKAAELRLKPQGEAKGNATGGKIKGTYTKGVSLRVQGVEVSNQLIALIVFPKVLDFEFDGIIGYDFINQFVVEIDYQNKVMNLYDPRDYVYAGEGEIVPLILDKRKTPLVKTEIALENRAIRFTANLEVDTGADSAFLINSPLVKKQNLLAAVSKTTEGSANGAGGKQNLRIGRVKAVRFGNWVIENPAVEFSLDTAGSGASKENDGFIGGEVFRRFKVILDYSRKRMMLEPNSSFNEPYEIDTDN